MTRRDNALSLSSEAGEELVYEVLRGLWPRMPQDYQIEAVVKLLDDIDVLANDPPHRRRQDYNLNNVHAHSGLHEA